MYAESSPTTTDDGIVGATYNGTSDPAVLAAATGLSIALPRFQEKVFDGIYDTLNEAYLAYDPLDRGRVGCWLLFAHGAGLGVNGLSKRRSVPPHRVLPLAVSFIGPLKLCPNIWNGKCEKCARSHRLIPLLPLLLMQKPRRSVLVSRAFITSTSAVCDWIPLRCYPVWCMRPSG